jgi:hypothetical protein
MYFINDKGEKKIKVMGCDEELDVLYEFCRLSRRYEDWEDTLAYVVRLPDGSCAIAMEGSIGPFFADEEYMAWLVDEAETALGSYRKALAMLKPDYRPTKSTTISSTTGKNGLSFVISMPWGA